MIDPTGAVSAVPTSLRTEPSSSGGGAGFGEMFSNAVQGASVAENRADSLVAELAAGGDVQLHEVAIATTEAALAVELLVSVRDQAVQAYQQITNLQL